MTDRSIEEFFAQQKAPRATVTVTMRADLLAKHSELYRLHARAIREDMGQNRTPVAPQILAEIAALEDEIGDSEFAFEFEGLGHHKYMRLVAQHPPRKQDRTDKLPYNPETFPAALFAASAIDPVLTQEQAVELCERLSDGQFSKLWNAAVSVNVSDDAAPKSARRSTTEAPTETSSNTALDTESPDQSSLDGS